MMARSARPIGGGVEWQTSLMARWLAERGHPVSLVTWREDDGPREEVIEGVRLIKMCREDEGLPGLRFLHPRWTSLVQALRSAAADVYYQNCGEAVTGQVALWCERNGRRFVYSVASDPDCDPRLPEMKAWRVRVLYRHGLRHADRVIVQKRHQQEMLREGFGVASEVIPMPCVGPGRAEYEPPESLDGRPLRTLFVGRIVEMKRLEWFLDAAEAIPHVVFEVAGEPDAETLYTRRVLQRARSIPNVVLHGRVDRERMAALYRGAMCLCCTSTFEGFPNTFLEAWSHGVPVVTTFDPDALVSRLGLGTVIDDVPGLIAAIAEWVRDPDRWRQASLAGRHYYLENHTVDAVLPRFERVFLDVARLRAPGHA